MKKETLQRICITFGIMAFFLCGMGLSAVYAEEDTAGKENMTWRLTNPNTGTGILGKSLFKNANRDPRELARDVIFTVLGVLGTLMVVLVVYAGFLWITAGGEEEKIKKAQHYLQNAIVGAVIVMSAWTISIFVLEALKKVATK